MKDALGHGSNAHTSGIESVGKSAPAWGKSAKANLETAKQLAAAQGHDVEIYRNAKNPSPAYYFQGKIRLNASNRYWRDPVGTMQRSTNLSSSSPAHVVHHEIGHAIYDAPDNFMTLQHQDLARTHVSKYAAMNPKEFVSEVHAGTKAGKTYPAEVMTAFNQYARPRR